MASVRDEGHGDTTINGVDCMLERIGAISIILGTVLGVFGSCWLVLRFLRSRFGTLPSRKLRSPMWLLLVSVLMTSLPIGINAVITRFQSLGPLSTIVDGERHLTLTGWDQKDYSIIAAQGDTIVLQMANADVTDETLQYLSGMTRLRELDLNNSQVTDAGLAVIAALPELKDLRLAHTKISDQGFRQHLAGKDSLTNVDLRGTDVASKTVREWKADKPDRRALK
ncbi:hypothetical protein [Schlesneria paludicola]|uniref:hypothetical protein n=1 Tax=Schlesneria paludicola TaxID=360056 RepID=UPI00029A7942|nr:hypothetical protein [Schlesneria paludicola]